MTKKELTKPTLKQTSAALSQVKMPGEAYSEHIRARFWLSGPRGGYVGIGRIELLKKIDHYGSMSQAAKQMGMSYKKAWKLINEMNAMYNQPLIIKETGGKAGGGSVLTAQGKQIIAQFETIEQEMIQLLSKLSKEMH